MCVCVWSQQDPSSSFIWNLCLSVFMVLFHHPPFISLIQFLSLIIIIIIQVSLTCLFTCVLHFFCFFHHHHEKDFVVKFVSMRFCCCWNEIFFKFYNNKINNNKNTNQDLIDFLDTYSRSSLSSLQNHNNHNRIQRPKRGIVDECCKRPCGLKTLNQYCGIRKRPTY